MNYIESYTRLKELFPRLKDIDLFDSVEFHTLNFESDSFKILPGAENYYCNLHEKKLKSEFSFYTEIGNIENNVRIKDYYVTENQSFNYYLLKPAGSGQINSFVFLFHGFNEKDWDKYLPWAKTVVDRTGKAVLLFPISFHMQRAPKLWSEKRRMYKLSEDRKNRFPNIIHSTLSNVAISMRLHSMPQRFIWSGLQTYYDVVRFIEYCRAGKHELINKNFDFDILAYSIGGFLAQILKLTNHNNYFDKAKVCLFCSGATFNRLAPVSKFIIDSEANVALYSFLVEHFDKMLEKDKMLYHFIKEGHMEGEVFYAMLDYQKTREFREALLKKYENDIYAITLKKDYIIPSFEVINTLQGAYRDINIRVDEIDFDYEYTHENPFPVNEKEKKSIDKNFDFVFEKICKFLSQKKIGL